MASRRMHLILLEAGIAETTIHQENVGFPPKQNRQTANHIQDKGEAIVVGGRSLHLRSGLAAHQGKPRAQKIKMYVYQEYHRD